MILLNIHYFFFLKFAIVIKKKNKKPSFINVKETHGPRVWQADGPCILPGDGRCVWSRKTAAPEFPNPLSAAKC